VEPVTLKMLSCWCETVQFGHRNCQNKVVFMRVSREESDCCHVFRCVYSVAPKHKNIVVLTSVLFQILLALIIVNPFEFFSLSLL
jgi:hypothetical protein